MGKDKREIRINGVFNTTINGEHHETIEIKELEGCITIGFRTRDDGVELDCGVVGDINSMDAAVAALEVFRKLPNGVKNLTMLTLADALGLGEKPDGGGQLKTVSKSESTLKDYSNNFSTSRTHSCRRNIQERRMRLWNVSA